MERNTLHKSERLSSERRMERLFGEGRRGTVGPVRFCWLVSTPEEGAAVSVLFSVPKKSFKRAWKRNLIKRRMRESFRTRKHALVAAATAAGRHIDIALICSPPVAKGAAATAKGDAKAAKADARAAKTSKRAPVPIPIPDFKTLDHAIEKILAKILERS